jgi:hypothetical protein
MSDSVSQLALSTNVLNINDLPEDHNEDTQYDDNEEDMQYDEEEMWGKTLWNDLTNLHKDIIASVKAKKKNGIIEKIKLFHENYGNTFHEEEENTNQELNFEEDRKNKAKAIFDQIKESIKPITHQSHHEIPEIQTVKRLNDIKEVNI